MTPEEMELGIKIAEIFLPHARGEIQRLYPRQTADTACFAHYTSAEAALSIIKNQQVWMRNTSVMNDYREVWHGFDCLTKAWANHGPALRSALNDISKDVGSEAETLFNSWAGNIRDRTYIASICERESQWSVVDVARYWTPRGAPGCDRLATALVHGCCTSAESDVESGRLFHRRSGREPAGRRAAYPGCIRSVDDLDARDAVSCR